MRIKELSALTLVSILILACHQGDLEEAYSSDATGKYDSADAPSECERWCEDRAPRESEEGFCPAGLGGEGCEEACAARLPLAPPELVQECIVDDALCFITLEGCVSSRGRRADCAAWCDFRSSEHADDGFCEPFLPDSPDEGCLSVCVGALVDDLPAQGVEDCVRDNPLCFVDLESCSM